VITVSDALGALAGDLGVPASQISVIPNGVDPAVFRRGDRNAARARLGLPADRTIVVGVGAFVDRKGHERILASLPALIAQRPGLLYVAIGNSGEPHSRLPAIRRLVERLGLADHVMLQMARPPEEIPTWLQAADLFCLATAREGRSNVLCESLACGLPVVTTRVDGNAEVVRDGENGYLVPFFDAEAFAAAISRALDRAWERDAIAEQAAGRTWEHVADEVMGAFHCAMADAGPPRPRRSAS
jgi:glycosyltransferase involved in cell wall biosynthesis